MGLPCQLSDFAGEPIFLFITMVADFFTYLRRRTNAVFNTLGFRFKWLSDDEDDVVVAAREPAGSDSPSCRECFSRLIEGDQVRRLECRHVFHTQCLEGIPDHNNFTCPLCLTPPPPPPM